jgi:predicted aspartyl protease
VKNITIELNITNYIDRILAERGFIPSTSVRSLSLSNVLLDNRANRLCLPADAIEQLGLILESEIDIQIPTGIHRTRVFKDARISINDRQGTFSCIEIPTGQQPLLGAIPMSDLGLAVDPVDRCLRVLPSQGQETYLMVF